MKTNERYVVAGGSRLQGRVKVSGAKNAALPILAAALLSSGESIIHNTPIIRDVNVMLEILRRLGVDVEEVLTEDSGRTLRIRSDGLTGPEVGADFTREMRSSIFLMGPLLARTGKIRISYPGGCAIGPRPIDFHLRGLEQMGAKIEERYGFIEASVQGRLVGSEIYLDFPSVGATENLMMAAVLADGKTVIRNAAREPEIVDLQLFLNRMGAKVRGAGLDVIRIQGVKVMGSVEHKVMPDRIEAGTFLAAAAITGGDVTVENVIPEHADAICAKLREMGTVIQEGDDWIRAIGPTRLRAADVKTLPYPGFATDMQPQMMALMAVAVGTSIITETIFENRFKVSDELRRLGANVKTDGRTAVVQGVSRLSGARVECPALREGMALVLAGMAAEGVTTIEQVVHIDRGYQNLEQKLQGLGAQVSRA
ncbi:MAG: UDP-N-acetylglucosamine enolpyruvyl transferase [Firmicutes bacterium]|nr:UDP-N-acetylglucosamine enolpyruvyl transferase [Bacillota bacterium]